MIALLLVLACTGPADTGTPEDTGRTCASVDPDPALTDEGWVMDGWGWNRQGSLWPQAESPGSGDGDLAPALVALDEGLRLVFTRKQGLEHSLWTSTSADGLAWTEPEALQGLPEDDFQAYPTLSRRGETLFLWTLSGDLSMATSTDGVHWQEEGSLLLGTGEAGSFDSLSVLYPSVQDTDEGWGELVYTGFDGATYALGRASSTDGLAWTRHGLVLEAGDDWDNRAVAQPSLVGEHLWYGGYDTSQTDPGPWRIGLATRQGERVGLSLPLTESGTEAWSTRDPAVLPWQDGWLMIYAGMGDDGAFRLHAATSSVCPD